MERAARVSRNVPVHPVTVPVLDHDKPEKVIAERSRQEALHRNIGRADAEVDGTHSAEPKENSRTNRRKIQRFVCAL